MNLHQDNLHRFFEIANQYNSHFTEPTNTYDFLSRQSRTLCVTIGDSWTWGTALHNRLDEVYGNTLSMMIDADWLNLGLPGVGNHFIARKVIELDKIAKKLNYDKIFVFCTFTETGRQLDSDYDKHLDFLKYQDFDQFVQMLNDDAVNIIRMHSANFTKTVIGSNFVNPLGFTDSTFWLDLIYPCHEECYAALHGLWNIVDKMPALINLDKSKTSDFKEWATDFMDRGERRMQTMIRSKRFSHDHPIEKDDHSIWAKHLFGKL